MEDSPAQFLTMDMLQGRLCQHALLNFVRCFSYVYECSVLKDYQKPRNLLSCIVSDVLSVTTQHFPQNRQIVHVEMHAVYNVLVQCL